MLFNSISFVYFFLIVVTLYYIFPHPVRWFILLAASCIFYMYFIPVYILVLFYLIIVDYFAGLYIEKSKGKKRNTILLLSVISNIAVLFVFKYFGFFNQNLSALASVLRWNYPIQTLNIILPLGLSFHTFQSLSYVIEVYKRKQKAEKHFGIYALYVMFFPQLVAGPIERPQHMLHQFHTKHTFPIRSATDGLQLMVFGFFKKIVLADRLAVISDQVFWHSHDYIGLPLLIAAVAFAFQIYCDFSGYSDIAIGAAKVLGFDLTRNFNYPYISESISEFWRRWHISLSSWFRDYVYIPLGGSRVSVPRHYANILIVFLLSGLWHGASWTFVVWGGLHGIGLIIEHIFNIYRSKARYVRFSIPVVLWKHIRIVFTFSLVCLGWVFFRASSIGEALYIIKHMPRGLGNFFSNLVRLRFSDIEVYLFKQGQGLGTDYNGLLIIIAALSFMVLFEYLYRKEIFFSLPISVKWSMYIIAVLAIFNLGIVEEIPFIYFQF